MRKLKRNVERNKRNLSVIAGKTAVAMLAASVAVAGMPAYVCAGEPVSVVRRSVVPADATVIDISAAPITNGRINVEISENGAYKLTGSNIRNDAYVDVQIKVLQRTTVDLYIDDLHILNDDSVDDSLMTTTYGFTDSIAPFIIDGTANVYILSDSTIEAVASSLTVNGTLNIEDSEGDASLTFGLSKVLPRLMGWNIDSGVGKVYFNGGHVIFKATTTSGESYGESVNNPLQLILAGGKVTFDGRFISFFGDMNIYSNVYRLDNVTFTDGIIPIKNMKGTTLMYASSVSGFPANSEVILIDDTDVTGFLVNSEGVLENFWYDSYSVFYVKDGDNVTGYSIMSDYTAKTEDTAVVSFVNSSNGQEINKYYSVVGHKLEEKLQLQEENPLYNYKYELEDGTLVNADTIVSGDMTVKVTITEKDNINVNVNGEMKTVEAGNSLASIGVTGLLIDIETGNLVSSSEVITEARSFKTVNLQQENRNGEVWFKLSNADDVKEFAELVNLGATGINGFLTDDVTLDNDFEMIGTYQKDDADILGNSYRGVFDGQNHTVTLNLTKTDMTCAGLFGCITTGSVIKNVITAGSVTGNNFTAGLAGCVVIQDGANARIENCINNADVTAVTGAGGGITGGMDRSFLSDATMGVDIIRCGNTGTISSAHFAGGISGGSSGTVNATDCFNMSSCCIAAHNYGVTADNCYTLVKGSGVGTEMSSEAFLSGEVTYLLNANSESKIWLQTCNTGYPSFIGDAETQTVYAGYADCTTEVLSFANSEFEHVVQGHMISDELRYEDGKIFAGCRYCEEELCATVMIPSEATVLDANMVTVAYDNAWAEAHFPTVTIKYSDSVDGDYQAEKPSAAGIWCVKAFVGEEEFLITDSFTVFEAPSVSDNDPGAGNGSVSGNDPVETPDNNNGAIEEYVLSEEEKGAAEYRKEIAEIADKIEEVFSRLKSGELTGEQKIKVSSGDSLPNNLINALRDCEGVVLVLDCKYEDVEYHFEINNEDVKKFDPEIPWYGPLYLNRILNSKEVK